jgi:hypothetical protein
MNDKDKYYKMAEDWAEAYLRDNTEPKEMSIKQGEIIHDDLFFISVSLERLRYAGGREQQASYRRIREFKNYVQK